AFSQMDHRFGGGMIRPAIVDYLHTQVTPLLNGRYGDAIGAQLMVAAAHVTHLAGWSAYDVGREGLAQLHYGQALRLAKAGDAQLFGSHVLADLAQQAIDMRHPQSAVRLARAARDAGERAHACPRVMAMLLLREARATALGVSMTEAGDPHTAAR